MKTRKVYLLKDDTFTAARTKVEDIKVVDPISSIDIIVEMTTGAGMTEASIVKPHDEFTKIELVDGSDVIASASMKQWQALNVVELGKLPYMELTLETSKVQKEICSILFGLGRNDPDHYFDPGKFVNPQIKITNTFTAAAATSWAAAGHQISVIANVIEEGAAGAKGFLSAKDMYAFTAVDGAVETIDMPRDFLYRLIQIMALKTGSSPILTIEKLKLSCEADKYVPIEVDSDHLLFDNAMQFGHFEQRLKKRVTGAGVIYGDLYDHVRASLGQDTSLSVAGVLSIAGEAITMEVLVGAAGVNALSAVEGVVSGTIEGYAPHSCIFVPFGRLDHPEDWFNAPGYKDIKLKLTGESALGAVNVLIQQLRV